MKTRYGFFQAATHSVVAGFAVRAAFCVAVLAAIFTIGGCRSILHKQDEVNIQSARPGVEFEIVDKSGDVIAQGITPYVVQLKAKPFNGAWTIRFKNSSGEETTQTFKGKWKFVFFPDAFPAIFNGFFAGYVIDMATGKAYYLPSTVNLNASYNGQSQTPGMMIASIDDIRPEMRRYLIEAGSLQAVE